MEYLPAWLGHLVVYAGKYSIHGAYGIYIYTVSEISKHTNEIPHTGIPPQIRHYYHIIPMLYNQILHLCFIYHSWLNSILPWVPCTGKMLDLSRVYPWICFKCSVDSDDSALGKQKNTSDHILRYPSNSHCVCCVCWLIIPIWNCTIK